LFLPQLESVAPIVFQGTQFHPTCCIRSIAHIAA
jgi:hypothetical protein